MLLGTRGHQVEVAGQARKRLGAGLTLGAFPEAEVSSFCLDASAIREADGDTQLKRLNTMLTEQVP